MDETATEQASKPKEKRHQRSGVRFSARKRKKFIAALEQLPNVTRACAAAGVSKQTAYTARNVDPDFRDAWDKALSNGIEQAEDELFRRAVEGVEEPVFYEGKRVDVVRKYSDLLLIFLLKGHKPEKYRDNYNVTVSANVNHTHTTIPADLGRDLIFQAQRRMRASLQQNPQLAAVPQDALLRRFLNEVLRENHLEPVPLDPPKAALPSPKPGAPIASEMSPAPALASDPSTRDEAIDANNPEHERYSATHFPSRDEMGR